MKTFKLHDKVYDRWWPWKHGIIVKKLKTVLYVSFSGEVPVRYDKSHFQFLEKL